MFHDLRSAAAALAMSLLPLGCSSSPAAGPAEDAGAPAPVASSSPPPSDAGREASAPPAMAADAGSATSSAPPLVLQVPATFKGTPRELDVVVTATLPIAGPPAAILYQQKSPTVTAGTSLSIPADATGVEGNYYVVAVLYMQGGGQFSPASGIDYEAQSAKTFSFNGSSLDLGTMSLALVGADAGP